MEYLIALGKALLCTIPLVLVLGFLVWFINKIDEELSKDKE